MGFIHDNAILVISVGLAIAIAAGAFAFFTWADDRASARESLKVLDDYDNDMVRKLRDIRKRETESLWELIQRTGRKMVSVSRLEATRNKLIVAGRPTKDDVDRYVAARLLCFVGAGLVALFFIFVFPVFDGAMHYVVPGFFVAALLLAPDVWVSRLQEERQTKIRRALPDVLDIMTISVEAGLGFEQAVDEVVRAIPGPLSDELYRMLGEVRAGANRIDALRAIDDRTQVQELKSFILAITQADQFGVSIGGILRAQADEMRIKRRQLAQEKAQKLPVKMLLPMVFCIFPALLVVVLGPASIKMVRDLTL